MGIDAIALLRIEELEAPRSPFGTQYPLVRRNDAWLLSTFVRFHGSAPDELGLAVRRLLGDALDRHDDPRGILIFPDAVEPSGADYAAIVQEVGDAGVWAPKVALDHTPARYRAESGSHEALVLALIGSLGRDQAEALDLQARVSLRLIEDAGAPGNSRRDFEAARARVEAALGPDFAARYEASLRRAVAQDRADQLQRRAQLLQFFAPADTSDTADPESADETDTADAADAADEAGTAPANSDLEALRRALHGEGSPLSEEQSAQLAKAFTRDE